MRNVAIAQIVVAHGRARIGLERLFEGGNRALVVPPLGLDDPEEVVARDAPGVFFETSQDGGAGAFEESLVEQSFGFTEFSFCRCGGFVR